MAGGRLLQGLGLDCSQVCGADCSLAVPSQVVEMCKSVTNRVAVLTLRGCGGGL